jgi:hypothetical protein
MSDQKIISKVDSDFIKVYEPLLKKFIEEIKDVDKKNLPEPFIPVYGKNYGSSEYRIAFVGWETRNNTGLEKFYDLARIDPREALKSFFEEIDEDEGFPITGYANNFGTGFWNFVFKFLGKFHNEDWKLIKRKSHPDILKSFIWGNLESIERYEVTAKKEGGIYQEWEEVKKASKIFDRAELMIEALHPKILIVMQWQEDDKWIENIKDIEHEIIVPDYLEYYHLNASDTHIYWTRHPRGLSVVKIEEYISRILISINEKNFFSSFPGNNLFESLDKLNNQLKEVSKDLDISVDLLPYWGKDSGFYFTSSRWKDYMIGFEFEGNWGSSFFGGIRKIDNNNPLVSDISVAQKLGMTEKSTPYWPYWFWFEENYRNWNKKLFGEIQNGNFIIEIKKQVERMLLILNETEKE